MWLRNASNALSNRICPIGVTLQGVAAAFLAAMMFFTAADVAMRQLKVAFIGGDDIISLLMTLVISFGLVYCAIEKGHVKVDLIVELLPERAQAVVDTITGVLTTILGAFITWQGLANTLSIYHSGATSWTLNVILFPFAAVVAFGFAWFTLVLLAETLDSMAKLVKR